MKKYILILLLFLSGSSFSQTYLDSIPTVDNFGRVRNGIIAQGIIDVLNTDPSGVKLTETEIAYIRSIVGGLYLAGSWQKCKALYGFVGGNAWKHKWNWKDMRDLDDAFRLTWNGTVSHSSNGIKSDGVTGYGDTFLVPITHLAINNTHLSAYINSDDSNSSTSNTMRVSGTMRDIALITKRSNGVIGSIQPTSNSVPSNANGINISSSSAVGMYLGTHNGSEHIFIKDMVSVISSYTQNNWQMPQGKILLCCRNQSSNLTNNPLEFDNKTVSFASIGDGLTQQEAIQMSNIITTAQNILNRQ